MSATLTITGLEELRAALRTLPTELAGEAQHVVVGAANGAAADVRGAYPVRTGNLRDHVIVRDLPSGPFGTAAKVVSGARHAALFEVGTQARHTAIGANRGTMPPGHVFVPRIIRARRLMLQQLVDLVRRAGLTVTGYGG